MTAPEVAESASPHVRARLLAAISDAIYNHPDDLGESVDSIGGFIIDWRDRYGTQVAHIAFEHFEVIAFRGTQVASGGSLIERLRDIRFNLRIWPRRWAWSGRVHSGYHDAFERVRHYISEMVENSDETLPLYITGHSLGGALATLAAIETAEAGEHPDIRLVTFGAPKAATEDAFNVFVQESVEVMRIVMDGDLATAWPLSWTLAHPAPPIEIQPASFFSRRHGISKYVAALDGPLEAWA